MKVALFAAGLALLSLATPACASWAENANMRNPVYTGTERSLARAQQGLDRSTMGRSYRYHHRIHRSWRRR